MIEDPKVRQALETAERYADGISSDAGRSSARKAAQNAAQGRDVTRFPTEPKWRRRATSSVYWANAGVAQEAAYNAPKLVIEALVWHTGGHAHPASGFISKAESKAQSELAHDIFGNPFRRVAFVPAWCTSTALAIAQGIYDDRAFDRLPILADALQDAGCENDDILNHFRGDGPHVKGCWALDLVLGKE
jgi:hypothetical protein